MLSVGGKNAPDARLHQLVFSVGPGQRRPAEVLRACSNTIEFFFGGDFFVHLVVLFKLLVCPPLLSWGGVINTEFFDVLNGLCGGF